MATSSMNVVAFGVQSDTQTWYAYASSCAKVIYVDTDTLWMDFPATLAEHFEEMDTKNASFGLAEETYDGGSWYTIGKFFTGARL